MSSLRKVLWFVAALAVVNGVQACATETDPGAELNPQPLPPEAPGEAQEDDEGRASGSSSSGGGGSSGAPNAGADGEAGSDAGTGDGSSNDSGGDI